MKWSWISEMPTTQVRFAASVVATLCVVGKYVLSSTWVPDPGVLLFLGGWLGIDTTHFYLKRRTTFAPDGTKTTESAAAPGATP
jgi:hypothetical protein